MKKLDTRWFLNTQYNNNKTMNELIKIKMLMDKFNLSKEEAIKTINNNKKQ